MTEQLNLRLERSLLKELEDLAKSENLDRSALVKKIIIDGFNQERLNFALQNYLQQKISLERAAEIAKITIHEMLQIVEKLGIGSQFSIEDFQKMMK